MKQHQHARPQQGFIPIHMPRNTGAGFALATLSALFGFSMIWHMWAIGAACFALLLGTVIVHTFNYDRDYYVPADAVNRIELARTRQLTGHV